VYVPSLTCPEIFWEISIVSMIIVNRINMAGNVRGLLSVWAFENCQPKTKAQ
jgi:hypothetical protein